MKQSYPRDLYDQLKPWAFIVHECFCELQPDNPEDAHLMPPGTLLDLIDDNATMGHCHDIACEFMGWAHRHKVLAWPAALRYPHPMYPDADDPGRGYCFHGVTVVRRDGDPLGQCWAFDFTAEQFGIDDLPYVWPCDDSGNYRSL